MLACHYRPVKVQNYLLINILIRLYYRFNKYCVILVRTAHLAELRGDYLREAPDIFFLHEIVSGSIL
jgi:hypothetical protein